MSTLEKPSAAERTQLGKLLDEDKKLFLVEVGCQNISEMLQTEIQTLQKELEQRRSALSVMKQKNVTDTDQIRKLNEQIMSVEDQISRLELESLGFHTQTAKLNQKLEQQQQELAEHKVLYAKKKTAFEEKVIEDSVYQQKLVDMRTALREEQEKLEAVVKRNEKLLADLLQTYRTKLIVEESVGDEESKQRVLLEMSN